MPVRPVGGVRLAKSVACKSDNTTFPIRIKAVDCATILEIAVVTY